MAKEGGENAIFGTSRFCMQTTVCWCNDRSTRCKNHQQNTMVKLEVLKVYRFRYIFVFVMCYIYVTSRPSLLIESTDSMIHNVHVTPKDYWFQVKQRHDLSFLGLQFCLHFARFPLIVQPTVPLHSAFSLDIKQCTSVQHMCIMIALSVHDHVHPNGAQVPSIPINGAKKGRH